MAAHDQWLFQKKTHPDFHAQKVVSLPFLKNSMVAQVIKSLKKKSVGGRESSFITIPYLLGRLASKFVSSPQFSKVSGTNNGGAETLIRLFWG